ncbi:hypothetical protein E2C01_069122 [Portunus trituberculatus]|uniref:Uncharacterized protein n=1 Tax=Portunus trituberculatus TaxID=210409 RepID=A0A5B7HZR9_PORTR|nr:hypothetical protein [Portunus trituberculatus]
MISSELIIGSECLEREVKVTYRKWSVWAWAWCRLARVQVTDARVLPVKKRIEWRGSTSILVLNARCSCARFRCPGALTRISW